MALFSAACDSRQRTQQPSHIRQEKEKQTMNLKYLIKQWTITIRLFLVAVALAGLVGMVPTANAQVSVGGHVGIVIPWVTDSSGTTTTVFDSYSIGFPIGVDFKGQGPWAVSLETVPFVNQGPPHEVTFLVDPGILYGLEHGFTVGVRAAFSVNSPQVGFIPLINKSWKFKDQKGLFKAYYAEFDFPVQFSRPTGGPATNSVTFATHFGLGF
jgi:hypothetical protein